VLAGGVVVLFLATARTRSLEATSNLLALPLSLVAAYPAVFTVFGARAWFGEPVFAWAYLLFTMAGACAVARMPESAARGLHHALTITAIAFCLFTAPVLWRALSPPKHLGAADAVERLSAPWPMLRPPSARPDVYHLVLDGMGRPDVLEARYGMPAAPTVESLRRLGFDVDATRGHANYVQTHLSIASMLNGTYLDDLVPPLVASNERAPLRALIARARVPDLFARLGYEVEFIGGGSLAEGAFDHADRCDCPQLWLSEPELGALSLTPLKVLLASGVGHRQVYDRALAVFDAFAHERDGRRPRYVYAHVMTPHPPFVVDASGAFFNPGRALSGADASFYPGPAAEYITRYRGQAAFALRLALAASGRLIEAERRHRRGVIVIVTGDHGPRLGMDALNPAPETGRVVLPVLLAIRWPDGTRLAEAPSSLVNVYRALFQTVFGLDLPMLPDKAYLSSFNRPYQLVPVHGLSQSQDAGARLSGATH
jgi:hypothetical protein